MASVKYIKFATLGAFTLLFFIWLISGTLSTAVGSSSELQPPTGAPNANQDDYVGSETCAACHEEAFNKFSATKHANLSRLENWKDKVQGCESCHGPGAAHVADPSVANIISFKNKGAKETSETCLTCHAGKEEHNTFRRGEHWRNSVGCTSCHTAHGPDHGTTKAGSITFAGDTAGQKSNQATTAMLKAGEPQLCISCHTETKAQFSKPFRHKVLEGTMKCSDCHNPHGGFEVKQTRLAVGADASCIKCHADKQGPFVFEHAPLKLEGCAACHIPHGSANPKMLKRPLVRQLCLECHSSITDQLAPAPAGPFHNQANIRFQNCTICHVAIHGSNSHKAFFR